MGKKKPDMVSHAFAQTVRQLRERRRKGKAMTQEELARKLGMDRSYITALESGSHNPTLTTIWKLVPVLGVSPEKFMRHLARNYETLKSDPPATGNDFSALGTRAAAPPPRPMTPVEEKIRQLCDFMDQSPEMLWLADTKQRALYCNKPLRDYAGVAHQLGGLEWQTVFHPDDAKKYLAHSKKKFARREEYHANYRMRGADGEYRRMVQHAVPIFTPKGIFVGYLGTMIEDTENNH